MTFAWPQLGRLAIILVLAGGSAPAPAPARPVSVFESYLCNYGIVSAGRPAPLYRSLSLTKRAGWLAQGSPVYICDETQQAYQVRFGGDCRKRFTAGLRVETARRCASGWVAKRRVTVLSG